MNRKFTAIISATIVLSACSASSLENTYNSQESRIDSYLSGLVLTVLDEDGNPVLDEQGKPVTRKPEIIHNNGSNRAVIKDGQGEELSSNGSATIYYAGYIFENQPRKIFATNHRQTAEKENWATTETDYEPFTIDMKDKNIITGLKNGLTGVKQGEECIIVFSGKYGFGKHSLGTIPAKSALCYHIWVESIAN